MNRSTFYQALCFVLAGLLSFSSCGKKEAVPESEFTPYISAYTGGLISPSSSIWIQFINEQPDIAPNTPVKEKLFSFSPSLKGQAYWVNNKTIEFVPEEGGLKSGTTYEAEFQLGKVMKVEKRLKTFQFSFKVEEKDFYIRLDPLTISDPAMVTVNGTLIFSDIVDLQLLKKAFTVKTNDNQNLSPEITGTDNPKYFHFVIDDIKRGKADISLDIQINGNAFGVDKTVTENVSIPALDVFKVISAAVISEPETGIQITFSDPISTKQDLRGLIKILELSSFTYKVQNNKVNIYFDRKGVSKLTLTVDKGIRNTKDERLGTSFTTELSIEMLKPQVQLIKSGSIIPSSGNQVVLPFKAVNLRAVDMKIIKIFENNVLMFLQDNQLSESNELRRSGRLVYKKTFRLDTEASRNLQNWQNYSIDLSSILKQEPGAIYRVELSFKQEYSAYPCDGTEEVESTSGNLMKLSSDEITEAEESYWDSPYSSYYSSDYDWDIYEWNERENPCHASYYMPSERKVSCNVLMSNLGVMAKANSDNKIWVTVSNLIDTRPVANANITIYNYQLQPIGTGKTDADGFAVVTPKGKGFVLVAELDGQKTYLRLVDGEENSLSRFDVGGKKIEKGLKGFIYGERGVWRPGDTLHITFMLYDQEKKIPDNHPVAFELYNPRGQFYNKQLLTKGVNGFYTFHIPTKADDPTGLWNAYVKLGGTSFHKSLRIETVKPNRLKINMDFPGDIINASAPSIPVTLTSSWLTGATARNLKAKVEMTLNKTQTQFKGYEKYIFNNPATDFYTNESEVFSGTLDDNGVAKFNMQVPKAENAPGMLNANIVCRVFEQGGDASIYTQNIPFSPFSSYVGLNLNQEEGKYIETDVNHRFDIVTLNANGKPVDRSNLEYKIYRVSWSWWWQRDGESFSKYVNSSSYTPVAKGKLKTVNGKTNFTFKLSYPDWGRYLIYVVDKESGHATGGLVYIDWPSYRGRSDKSDPEGIKMLSFSTNKKTYEIGEDITVIIPASAGGSALVAMENGSAVLDRKWIQVSSKEDTKYTFKATREMAPNFYIHISLLQPHAQTINDLPIRMYGIVPVTITNKDSKLTPKIEMPDVLRPETEFTVKVSEQNGKPMTYTVAIVDDGLLDLTNFKTPNPWDEFYAREALGIRTWDMYDDVMGAFAGKYSSMFSVGGDENLNQGNQKANRFKPVVKHIGPFTLGKGESKTHKITLPMYVGSVRTMVVAGQDNAYGKAEKTTPVRSPLMILSSLPRVVSTGEEIMLPVNVFAMEDGVKNVSVKVETTGLLKTSNGDKKSLSFSKPGDDMVYFSMKTSSVTGIEKVTITATSGNNTAKETIEIDVRNPNPAIILSDNKLVNAGATANFNYKLSGGTNDDWVKLEVSRIPSVDISRRFDFLYDYQHYCSEQLTSRAFPLLYISQFKDVDSREAESIKKNVKQAINNLYGRQLSNGGFVYWPGQSSSNDWISSYVGNFLLVAKEKGYEVNEGVLNKWKNYQKRVAQNWSPSTANNYYSRQSELLQAYRLYTLALANAADMGAMNRMKEMKDLSLQARWRLAAAYAITGKTKAAEELVFNISSTVEPYWGSYTYGSSDRDEAMILETMVLMGRMEDAFKQAQKVSKKLTQENYFSTQSTAFSLVAMGTLAEKTSGTIEYNWTLNGKKQDDVRSAKAIYQKELSKKPSEGTVSLTNQGKGLLYVNLITKAKPVTDTLPPMANNLRLDVSYTDLSGNTISIDEIAQGTDFFAVVKVSNISASNDYTDIALTHIVPSGWEIFNERMTNDENIPLKTYTYQDIRDDRVLTYFDLRRGAAKTIRVRLQASYTGSFVLPAIQCEAMYDTSAQARTKAGRVKVVK